MITLLTLMHITPQKEVVLISNKRLRNKARTRQLFASVIFVATVVLMSGFGLLMLQKGTQSGRWLFTSLHNTLQVEKTPVNQSTSATQLEPKMIIVPMMDYPIGAPRRIRR